MGPKVRRSQQRSANDLKKIWTENLKKVFQISLKDFRKKRYEDLSNIFRRKDFNSQSHKTFLQKIFPIKPALPKNKISWRSLLKVSFFRRSRKNKGILFPLYFDSALHCSLCYGEADVKNSVLEINRQFKEFKFSFRILTFPPSSNDHCRQPRQIVQIFSMDSLLYFHKLHEQ